MNTSFGCEYFFDLHIVAWLLLKKSMKKALVFQKKCIFAPIKRLYETR